MVKIFFLCAVLCIIFSAENFLCAQEIPETPNNLTLSPNSLGALQNSVNLYTVETWNRESPTGILGLGWSFDFPRIVANHNNTATRKDDIFYLIEGGQSVRLICVDSDANGTLNYRSYKTEIYQPWQIHYYYDTEKRKNIKEDDNKNK